MKKTILKTVMPIIGFLFTSNVKGENTLGNVWLNSGVNSQEKTITMNLYWDNNQTWIEPVFSWDTIPGCYSNSYKPGRFYEQVSNFPISIKNISGCKNYYLKCEFTDGETGKKFTLENMIRTPGDKKPMIKGIQFPNMGYTFSELLLNVDPFCNNFDLEIKINQPGDLPNVQYKENWGDINNADNIHKFLYGLKPDTYYELTITVSSWLGTEIRKYGFQTKSNLLPFTESIRTKYIGAQLALCEVLIDPKNTQSQWRKEYGEDLHLIEHTDWFDVHQPGNYETYLYNLKSNTVYFERTVIRNTFGQYEDKIGLFKTTENSADIKEITWNDLLNVSNYSGGLTINVEKPALIEIYNISGSKLYSEQCDKKTDLQLNSGVYLIKMYIAGQVVTKKALVF